MPRGMHNPLPASLHSECLKARQILESFVDGSFTGSPGKEMPARVLGEAKGLAIITVTRAGFLGSIRVGSGILIARLENGSWSAPSAVATAGLGFGGQFGIELTDFVFILNERALRTFSRTGSLTLSWNISIAFGPFGRSAEVSGGASTSGLASMFSYSKTVGMYGGVTIEGGMLVERKGANRKFYNTNVTAEELLRGEVPIPGAAQSLMRVLAHKAFDPPVEMATPEEPVAREIPQPDGMVELSARAEAQPPSELPVGLNQPRESGVVPELDGTPCTPAELPSEATSQPPAELPVNVSEKPSRKPLRQDSEQLLETQDTEPAIRASPELTKEPESAAQAEHKTEAEPTAEPSSTEKLAASTVASPIPPSQAFTINA